VPEYNSGIHVLTPRLIEAARNRNLAVQPWTINERADLQRVLNLDVDGINTDYPDRLLTMLR
jgi:glycerophosphoryl diester phosphodiesterase